jgi:hypothetical protein
MAKLQGGLVKFPLLYIYIYIFFFNPSIRQKPRTGQHYVWALPAHGGVKTGWCVKFGSVPLTHQPV